MKVGISLAAMTLAGSPRNPPPSASSWPRPFPSVPARASLSTPCAGYGAVGVGDLLTVSPTRGHAMRADDPAPGTVVGKALELLEAGRGEIEILVMLR